MFFQIIRADISKITADAIVNTANPNPIVGKGTDGKIYEAAGREKLLAVRKEIGKIACGDAKITPAFDLSANSVKFIIHAVAPIWQDGNSGEADTLRKCYRNSLALALENNCKSIAFPLLAAGINNFPKDTALDIAINEIHKFIFGHEILVILAVFDKEVFKLIKKIYPDVAEFVGDKAVASAELAEYGGGGLSYWRLKQKQHIGEAIPTKSFRECLFDMIEARGIKKYSDVYRAADSSAKVFSDIRNKKNYLPLKKTAIAFAIALKLSLQETQELLQSAGYVLSNAIEPDASIMDFIRRGICDIDEINYELAEKNLPTLKVRN